MLGLNSPLCFKLGNVTNLRFLSSIYCNTEILCDIFGLPKSRAKTYIDRYKLQYTKGELLKGSIQFCQKLGYSYDEILKNPTLLRTHPLQLEQRYLSMEEGGFQSIRPDILARARYYMKTEIKRLKSKKLICYATDVPQSILSYIQDKEIADKIPFIKGSDYQRWNEVHLNILQSFLKWRLDATDDEIITLFRIHRMIQNKSFRVIQENISLAEELGFERRKILKYGYLLHNYPNYPKTVLADFPNLAGVDMRKAMRQYPKLIMTSPKNFLKIYGILKEFNIEDETIRRQMNVFNMSPETVRLRLEEVRRLPELNVLLEHPKILSLIVHHNRAKSRLSFLQQLQLKCASLMVLGTDSPEKFDDYIREGKDVNKYNDVVIFFKNLFKVDTDTIKRKLKRHPYYLQVPLIDIQNSYDYLIKQHFHIGNILKVMHIVLYPIEKIEKALNEMKQRKDIKYTYLSQVKRLRLVLYFIEKEHHFTGNGIWRKYSTDMPDKTLE